MRPLGALATVALSDSCERPSKTPHVAEGSTKSMVAEVGQFALILAFLLALIQAAAPLWGAHRADPVLMALGRQASLLQAGFVIAAFGCLAWSYIACDFSVRLV